RGCLVTGREIRRPCPPPPPPPPPPAPAPPPPPHTPPATPLRHHARPHDPPPVRPPHTRGKPRRAPRRADFPRALPRLPIRAHRIRDAQASQIVRLQHPPGAPARAAEPEHRRGHHRGVAQPEGVPQLVGEIRL